jgi:phage-related protein
MYWGGGALHWAASQTRTIKGKKMQEYIYITHHYKKKMQILQ